MSRFGCLRYLARLLYYADNLRRPISRLPSVKPTVFDGGAVYTMRYRP